MGDTQGLVAQGADGPNVYVFTCGRAALQRETSLTHSIGRETLYSGLRDYWLGYIVAGPVFLVRGVWHIVLSRPGVGLVGT